jgi:hypothetical protein
MEAGRGFGHGLGVAAARTRCHSGMLLLGSPAGMRHWRRRRRAVGAGGGHADAAKLRAHVAGATHLGPGVPPLKWRACPFLTRKCSKSRANWPSASAISVLQQRPVQLTCRWRQTPGNLAVCAHARPHMLHVPSTWVAAACLCPNGLGPHISVRGASRSDLCHQVPRGPTSGGASKPLKCLARTPHPHGRARQHGRGRGPPAQPPRSPTKTSQAQRQHPPALP